MTTGISAGKFWGMRRLADADGLFRMVALDQRPPIMGLIKEKLGRDEAPDDQVSAVKRLIAEVMAPYASALLMDPIWAYPSVIDAASPRQGLILTLEDHRFEETRGGRKTSSIADWSVAKIKRLGGDGVKVLAYYRADAAPEIVAHQQAYVREVGEACRVHDIPFVLELIVYPLASAAPGSDDTEDAAKRPELVVESVRAFAGPEYGVDIFKLESPIPAVDVPEPSSAAAGGVQRLFNAMGEAAGRPWVMLSLGATKPAFERVLHYAFHAGASGFLAGRAIWLDAAQAYPDLERMRQKLAADGVAYLKRITNHARAEAQPWFRHPRFADGPTLEGAGLDFPSRYAAPT